MDYVEDSAKPASLTEMGEDTVMGIANESKALGKAISPPKKKSSRKMKLDADGNPIEKKKKTGGRKPEENSTELMSYDRHKMVEGETKKDRWNRMQRIRI